MKPNSTSLSEKYACDKCQVATLGSHEYDQYTIMQYHYCEPCWNYVHLKKGILKQNNFLNIPKN